MNITSFYHQRPQELYGLQLKALKETGDEVEVRGRWTVELLNVTTYLERPTDPCILIQARRWNPWLAISEGLWILAGRNDVAALKPYNSNITDFSDDDVHLYGAYGARMYHQIDRMIQRLKADPSDRRAVLQIWNQLGHTNEGWTDLATDSKDPPCNDMVMFKLRKGKLHMTVLNRSNDIHWGLYAVNLPTFQMLQQYIAARLGVRVGSQTHFSNSLHFYTDDIRARRITANMMDQDVPAVPEKYPAHELMFEKMEYGTHAQMSAMCSAVLDDRYKPLKNDNIMPFLSFAQEFLRMYRERNWKPELLDPRYADWIKAGDLFVGTVWRGRD